MVKKVVDNGSVGHLWLTQKQNEAASHNGNFWFQGKNIYSYRTMIGAIHEAKNGPVVLTTCHRYSVTTSGKHMRAINIALIHEQRTAFDVPDLLLMRGHGENLAYFQGQYHEALLVIAKTPGHRDINHWNLETPRNVYYTMHKYCAAFELPVPFDDARVAMNLSAAIATHQARVDKYMDPKAVKRRERAAAMRNFKKLVGI